MMTTTHAARDQDLRHDAARRHPGRRRVLLDGGQGPSGGSARRARHPLHRGRLPGSNPKDLRFFRRMQDVTLKHAKLAAFSMTRRAGGTAESDANMQALLDAGAPVATIVGKSWDFHVTHALSTTLDENLKMIADTIAFLRPRMDEVMFDAEHFFDGFRRNREYALATLRAAETAGAHWVVLCDTNGGTLPHDLVEVLRVVKTHVKAPLAIHVHNDAECAVANSLAA